MPLDELNALPFWWVEEPAISLYVADKPYFYTQTALLPAGWESVAKKAG